MSAQSKDAYIHDLGVFDVLDIRYRFDISRCVFEISARPLFSSAYKNLISVQVILFITDKQNNL